MSQEIIANLDPLFKEAEEKGLWFYSNYQDLWFTPNELRAQHAKGYFIWGPANWKLLSPDIRLQELVNRKDGAEKQINEFKERKSNG